MDVVKLISDFGMSTTAFVVLLYIFSTTFKDISPSLSNLIVLIKAMAEKFDALVVKLDELTVEVRRIIDMYSISMEHITAMDTKKFSAKIENILKDLEDHNNLGKDIKAREEDIIAILIEIKTLLDYFERKR